MKKKVILNAKVVRQKDITPPTTIWIRDGKIQKVDYSKENIIIPDDYQIIEADGQLLIPGMIDVHIHGANGNDMMDGTEESILEVSRTCALTGCTSFLVTSVTSSMEDCNDDDFQCEKCDWKRTGGKNCRDSFRGTLLKC